MELKTIGVSLSWNRIMWNTFVGDYQCNTYREMVQSTSNNFFSLQFCHFSDLKKKKKTLKEDWFGGGKQ